MPDRPRLGIPHHLYARPVRLALEAQGRFDLRIADAAHTAIALRSHDIDAGLLTPIDFARDASAYRIVPDAAIRCSSGVAAITLHFGEGIHGVRTFAADPSSTAEIVLTRLVLAEAFDLDTTVIPATGSVGELMTRADAVLLYGDASLSSTVVHSNAIDLVEEWYEITSLPFVHALWCAREDTLQLDDWESIRRAHQACDGFRNRAAHEAAPQFQAVGEPTLRAYLDAFSYDLDIDGIDSVREFLSYSYYHGILPDIPDLHFLGGATDARDADGAALN